MTLDTPKGLQPLHPGIKPNPSVQPVASSSSSIPSSKPAPLNLDLRKQVYQTTSKGLSRSIPPAEGSTLSSKNLALNGTAANGQKAFSCDTCGVDCTRTRYHSLKDSNYSVCPACYLSGRFPSTMFSGDFVRMDDVAFKHASANNWTDQETLLLLEGIEMHDEDWTAISDHVQTRTRDQCILKFLQLPIEDPYLAAASTDVELGPLKYAVGLGGNAEALPFAKADNPVMSVVAFLASTVGPGVAAAAAGRAMGELTGDLKDLVKQVDGEASGPSVDKEVDGGEKTETEGDASMQVDGEVKTETEQNGSGAPAATTSSEVVSAGSAPSQSALQQAASVSLAAAATKASLLASQEERQLQALVSRLVSAQLKKLELKMAHFEQLEEMVEHERRAVEVARQQVYKERLRVVEQSEKVKRMMEQAQNAIKMVESQIAREKAGLSYPRAAPAPGGSAVGFNQPSHPPPPPPGGLASSVSQLPSASPSDPSPIGFENLSADVQGGLDALKELTELPSGPVMSEADVSMEQSPSTNEQGGAGKFSVSSYQG